MKKHILLLAVILTFAATYSQEYKETHNSPKHLYDQVVALDKAVFDAFNNCEVEKFRSYFTNDAEFYHDRGGLTLGGSKIAESVKNNICGNAAVKVRRELVPGSVSVYSMDNYGAIIIGEHTFYQTVNGVEQKTGRAKFTHLCEFKDKQWKIHRVLSYDHTD